MSATAQDLRSLEASLGRLFPRYSRDLAARSDRLSEFLLAHAARLETPGAQPDRIELVFRPVGDAWELGYARSPIVMTPRHSVRVLQAARAAFSQPGRSVDLVTFLVGPGEASCVSTSNAFRNELRRATAWVKAHVDCRPLVRAMRELAISRDAYMRWMPEDVAPRIDTE